MEDFFRFAVRFVRSYHRSESECAEFVRTLRRVVPIVFAERAFIYRLVGIWTIGHPLTTGRLERGSW